jgi:hypothetical protein
MEGIRFAQRLHIIGLIKRSQNKNNAMWNILKTQTAKPFHRWEGKTMGDPIRVIEFFSS